MSESEGPRYRIEAIRSAHERNDFDCGHPFLNQYLARYARQNDRSGIAKAFVMVPAPAGNPVVGYYTLAAGAVAFEKLPKAVGKKLPRYPVPVARIGELAVDERFQGKGLGSALLIDALRRILDASREVAAWAVVVDPIDVQAACFYRKFGFVALADSEIMFLPMKEAAAWLM